MDKRVPKIIFHPTMSSKFEFTGQVFSDKTILYKVKEETILLDPKTIEIKFLRDERPEPKSDIIVQGKYECAAAALAMLLDEKLFNVKRAMGKMGWRNDNKGAGNEVTIGASRLLGRDVVHIRGNEINETIGPCVVHIDSLNIKGMAHAITWNGKEILDPNWGREGRKFWGTEWAPWTLRAQSAFVLLEKNLTEAERAELDEAMRARDAKELKAIKESILNQLKGVS